MEPPFPFPGTHFPIIVTHGRKTAILHGHWKTDITTLQKKIKVLGYQTSSEHTKKQYKIVNIIKFIHLFCFPKKKVGFVNSETNLRENF